MALSAQYFSKTYLPGGGFNSSGTPVQGKVRVTGQLTGTTGQGTNVGVTLAPQVFGLTNIDYIQFQVTSAATNSPATTATIEAVYYGGALFVSTVTWTATNNIARAVYTSNSNITLSFEATGDDARDVALL